MESHNKVTDLLLENSAGEIKDIASKVFGGERITADEGLWLYQNADLGSLGIMANFLREKYNGQRNALNFPVWGKSRR